MGLKTRDPKGFIRSYTNTVSQAGLTKDKERELNDAIQAHFREWLQGSSLLRQIYDLSNLERADEAALSANNSVGHNASGSQGGMAAAAAAAATAHGSMKI